MLGVLVFGGIAIIFAVGYGLLVLFGLVIMYGWPWKEIDIDGYNDLVEMYSTFKDVDLMIDALGQAPVNWFQLYRVNKCYDKCYEERKRIKAKKKEQEAEVKLKEARARFDKFQNRTNKPRAKQ